MAKKQLNRKATLEAIALEKPGDPKFAVEALGLKADEYLEQVCENIKINPIYEDVPVKIER